MTQPRLKQEYLTRVVPSLTKRFGYTNRHQVPRLLKVVVNTTTKDAVSDAKVLDIISEDIGSIAGQRPVRTFAKRAISAFKIRQGMPLGVKVTRLARGLPFGSDLEYADEQTMARALEGRHEL